jgi:chromosomal replication initiation ATPase DnaA
MHVAEITQRIEHLRNAGARLNLAADALEAGLGAEQERTLDCAMEEIYLTYHVRSVAIFAKSRIAHVVAARHMLIYILRQMTPMSYEQIGVLFNRDHSSICHADHGIGDRVEMEPKFAASTALMLDAVQPASPGVSERYCRCRNQSRN